MVEITYAVLLLLAFGIISGASGGLIISWVMYRLAKRLGEKLDEYMTKDVSP